MDGPSIESLLAESDSDESGDGFPVSPTKLMQILDESSSSDDEYVGVVSSVGGVLSSVGGSNEGVGDGGDDVSLSVVDAPLELLLADDDDSFGDDVADLVGVGVGVSSVLSAPDAGSGSKLAPRLQLPSRARSVVLKAAVGPAVSEVRGSTLLPRSRALVSSLLNPVSTLLPLPPLAMKLSHLEHAPVLWSDDPPEGSPYCNFTTSPYLADHPLLTFNERLKHLSEVTCMSVGLKFISIGFGSGTTSTFDIYGSLLHTTAPQGASITALAVYSDLLAYGDALGTITVVDIITKKQMRHIATSVSGHGSSITSISVISPPASSASICSIISTDTLGITILTVLSKNLILGTTATHECLLDGKAGKVLAVDCNFSMVALASEKSSFCIQLHPSVRVIHKWPKPESLEIEPSPSKPIVPSLHWGVQHIPSSGQSHVLARAWGTRVQFLQCLEDGETLAFGVVPSMSFQTDKNVLILKIVSSRSACCIKAGGEIDFVDTLARTLLVRIACPSLVYSTITLSTGITASNFAPSVTEMSGRIYILADDGSLVTVEEVPFSDIIERKILRGEWLEALASALEYYRSSVVSKLRLQRSVTDTVKNHAYFKSEQADELANFVVRYVKLGLENENNHNLVFSVTIEYLAAIDRLDVLYNVVYNLIPEGAKSTFVSLLEPFVLKGSLRYISPMVMSEFITSAGTEVLERVILNLDVTVVDYDFLIRTCKSEKMWIALLYVFSTGLGDFICGIEMMMGNKTDSDVDDHVLSIALLFLTETFYGRSFPSGQELPEGKANAARTDIIEFLVGPGLWVLKTLLRGEESRGILFDLFVLVYTNGDTLQDESVSGESDPDVDAKKLCPSCENVCNVLFSISPTSDFYAFIARLLLERCITTAKMDRGIVEGCVLSVATNSDVQADLISLIETLSPNDYDVLAVSNVCSKRDLNRASAALHKIGGDGFDVVVHCYLIDEDEDYAKGVFKYIDGCLHRPESVDMARNGITSCLERLILLDAGETARLVGEVGEDVLEGIEDPAIMYLYLDALAKLDELEDMTEEKMTMYLSLMRQVEPEKMYTFMTSLSPGEWVERVEEAVNGVYDAEGLYWFKFRDEEGKGLTIVMNEVERLFKEVKMSIRVGGLRTYHGIEEALGVAVALCELGAKSDHWFFVLDKLLALRESTVVLEKDVDKRVGFIHGELVRLLMCRLVGNMSTVGEKELVEKITSGGNLLGEFRDVLRGILGGYRQEVELWRGCESIMVEDTIYLSARKMSEVKKGVRIVGSEDKGLPKIDDEDTGASRGEGGKITMDSGAYLKARGFEDCGFGRRRKGKGGVWITSRDWKVSAGPSGIPTAGKEKQGSQPIVLQPMFIGGLR